LHQRLTTPNCEVPEKVLGCLGSTASETRSGHRSRGRPCAKRSRL
jgi:hypothetical protein